MHRKKISIFIALVCSMFACEKNETGNDTLELLQVFVGPTEINLTGDVSDGLPVDRSISLAFSLPLDQTSATESIILRDESQTVETNISLTSQNKTVVIYPTGPLSSSTTYTLKITDQLKGASGESFASREVSFKTALGNLEIASIQIGGKDAGGGNILTEISLDLAVVIDFSLPVDKASFQEEIDLMGPFAPQLSFSFSNNDQTVSITGSAPLQYLRKYRLAISNSLKGAQGESFLGFSNNFYTGIDETPKFPVTSDDDLLTKVQQQTFKYFWDFAHPNSGLARERNTSGDLVTIGGSGFGVMAILVGIERGFIIREQGVERLTKIVDFLAAADRFHGVWPHWMNGNSGDVIPFSPDDNGGDLVETAFMIQGLLAVRAYLDENSATEKALLDKITGLWEEVEWDWYTQNGQNVLYWHWSPDFEWQKNHKIQGWNEALIIYVLAASSPTHAIDVEVYHEGWTRNGGMVNGKEFYGITLPLGNDLGGPLFFAHYSFLGLDPRNLQDQYADYWTQNVNHSLINQAYCIDNPKNYLPYSEDCWGLTASDNHKGYSAHSPSNDLGVITPTAALSSFPYTPAESMKALKFFYYTMGDRLWGDYGFYDAFNVTEGWEADSYLAIDQGPIVVMIENHRSGMLWDLFMTDQDVQSGLNALEFSY